VAKSETRAQSGKGSSQFQVPAPKLEAKEWTQRLREMVRTSGGAKEVARRSGVPFGTLQNYLAGGEMKFSAAIAIAEACGIRIEWLAEGRGADPGSTIVNPAPAAAARLFSQVDVSRFAEAFDAVSSRLAGAKIKPPTERVLRAAFALYDLMREAESPVTFGSDVVPRSAGVEENHE
jgi:transcriptional regulator with XRE-family HTH domain